MLHVNSAVSGKAIATIQLHEFDGKFVKELKQSLVAKTGFTRFQQKLLCQDHGTVCLDDDLLIPGNFQLVFLPFLAQDESGQEICQLHRACRDCDFQAIEVILQEPQDPNFSDRDGNTALHWAAQSGAAAECGALLVEAAVLYSMNLNPIKNIIGARRFKKRLTTNQGGNHGMESKPQNSSFSYQPVEGFNMF